MTRSAAQAVIMGKVRFRLPTDAPIVTKEPIGLSENRRLTEVESRSPSTDDPSRGRMEIPADCEVLLLTSWNLCGSCTTVVYSA